MIRREGRWIDVRPGQYVRDDKGRTWRVLSWNHKTAKLRGRNGREVRVRPSPYSEVTILTIGVNDVMKMVEATFPGAEVIHDTKGK